MRGEAPPGFGESQPAPAPSKLVWLDPTGLIYALPEESHVGEVFVGGDPFLAQGAESEKHCAKETGAACTGLLALAGKDMEVRGNSDGTRVEFRLYAFETAEQAGTALKSLAGKERKKSDERGDPTQPVTVASGADETDAFHDDATAEAFMRIGAVVAHAYTTETKPGALEHVAKVQVERVRTVAGKNAGY